MQSDTKIEPAKITTYIAPVDELALFKNMWASPAGKIRIAARIAGMLPDHRVYTEAFAGSAAVLFAKPECEVEAINDADPDIASAYTMIKSLTDEDVEKLRTFDWVGTKSTYEKIFDSQPTEVLEKLYRFLYVAHFSYGKKRGRTFNPGCEGNIAKTAERVAKFVPRMRKIHVYSGDYEEVVKKYDAPDAVHFLDPPYTGYNVSVGESKFDEDRFMKMLEVMKGKFLITYGIRGTLPGMLYKAGYTIKRIRTRRSMINMRNAGGSMMLTQIVVTNYDDVKKMLDNSALFPDVDLLDFEGRDEPLLDRTFDEFAADRVSVVVPACVGSTAVDCGLASGGLEGIAKSLSYFGVANELLAEGLETVPTEAYESSATVGMIGDNEESAAALAESVRVSRSVSVHHVAVGKNQSFKTIAAVRKFLKTHEFAGATCERAAGGALVTIAKARAAYVPVFEKRQIVPDTKRETAVDGVAEFPSVRAVVKIKSFGCPEMYFEGNSDSDRKDDFATLCEECYDLAKNNGVDEVRLTVVGQYDDGRIVGREELAGIAVVGRPDDEMTCIAPSGEQVHLSFMVDLADMNGATIVTKAVDNDQSLGVVADKKSIRKSFELSGVVTAVQKVGDQSVYDVAFAHEFGVTEAAGKTLSTDVDLSIGDIVKLAVCEVDAAKSQDGIAISVVEPCVIEKSEAEPDSIRALVSCAAANGTLYASTSTIAQLEAGGMLIDPSKIEKRVNVPICKRDDEKRIVTGVVLVPEVVDAQGDVISAEAIAATARDFLAKYNADTTLGFMHSEFGKKLELVESYVAPVKLTLGEQEIPAGSWVLSVRVVDDDVWALVKSGKITGFSVGGTGKSYSTGGK